jgi:hypothetical protein
VFHRSRQILLEPSNQALRLKTSVATVILDAKGTLAEATKGGRRFAPQVVYMSSDLSFRAGPLGRELLAQKFLCFRRLSIPLSKLLGRQETDQALTNRRPVVGYFPDQVFS